MFSSRTRIWSLGTAALCVLLLVASFFALIGPRRSQAAELVNERSEVVKANAVLSARIADLKVEATKQSQREAQLATIERQMTPITDISNFVRDLDSIAAQSGAELVTVTPAAAVLLDPTGKATGATAGATAGSAASTAGSSSTGSSASATTGGSGTATGTAASASVAANSALVALPLTIVVRGDYFEAALFLKKAQTQLTRLLLVGAVTVAVTDPQAEAGDPANGIVDMTINSQVYLYWPDLQAVGSAFAAAAAANLAGTSGTATGATGTSRTSSSSSTTPSSSSTTKTGENQ